jgi:hypothetical protein
LLSSLESLGESARASGKLISGHWCGASFGPAIQADWAFTLDEVNLFHERSGKWVGLISCWLQPGYSAWGDLDSVHSQMCYDDIKRGFREHWDAGGLLHAGASFSCPLATHYGDRYHGRKAGELVPSAERLMTSGTPENSRWMCMLDRLAGFFSWCDAQGMVVIWRPFTELYLEQFWYGKLDNDGFRQLWRHMHRYFTDTKGLRCLLWEFNGRNRQSPRYPGDDYVDLFASSSSYEPGFVHRDSTGSRPWAQGELGNQDDYNAWVEKAKATAPYMAYFLTWDRGFGPAGHPSAGPSREFNETYLDALRNPWVLNRGDLALDRLPGWR